MDSGLLIAAEFSWLSPGSWWAMLQVILGIGLVIFIHELGHFLVAKACGVKCEKFYVGFDFFDIKIGDRVIVPRSLLKFQHGETEYGIGIVPLGGYVKMLGQEDNPSNMERENERARQGGAVQRDTVPEAVEAIDRRDQLDPRSFQAKSVLQRMMIISAGVVFNLVSAVVFAAVAFYFGVPYTPPVIGEAVVGGPAWRANLAGHEVLSVNGKSARDGYFPYIDLVQETALNQQGAAMKFELAPYDGSGPKIVEVTPESGVVPGIPLSLIGISDEKSAQIGQVPEIERNKGDFSSVIIPGQAASQAVPPLMPGDRFVSINGFNLPEIQRDGRTLYPVRPMKKKLSEYADQAIDVVVDRNGSMVKSTIPPNPSRSFGIFFGMTEVIAVQQESPAAEAGLRKGDEIVEIDGQPVGDPLSIDQRIAARLRGGQKELILGVRREDSGPDSELVRVVVVPRMPVEPAIPASNTLAISTLGVAVNLTPEVAGVIAGSQAEKLGVQTGDVARKVTVVADSRLMEDEKAQQTILAIRAAVKDRQPGFFGRILGTSATPATDTIGDLWIIANNDLPTGTGFRFDFEREGKLLDPVLLHSYPSDTVFLSTRGVVLEEMKSIYNSTSMAECLQLGAEQTWNDAGRIGKTLGRLLTGQISPKNLGGPGTIAVVATMEATAGTSRLLLFLTMLSANLAIVNFLPIPVLDGGHMMFLSYEGLFRRPMPERIQVLLSYVGLFVILGLMIFVFSMDISRIASLLGW